MDMLSPNIPLQKIYDAIPGSRYDSTQPGYVFPASTSTDKLPVLKFGVGTEGREFAINVADLAFAPAGNGTFADAGQYFSRYLPPRNVMLTKRCTQRAG